MLATLPCFWRSQMNLDPQAPFRATLYKRISIGWNAERSIATPPIKFKDRPRIGGSYAPMKL